MNKGIMSQMQANPDDQNNDCYWRTEETNALLLDMFDFTDYVLGGFDVGSFFDKTKVMNISLMQELEACQYNEYLVKIDFMLNYFPNAVASGSNLLMQLLTGFSDGDTSFYISLDLLGEAWDAESFDYEKFGRSVQLMLA